MSIYLFYHDYMYYLYIYSIMSLSLLQSYHIYLYNIYTWHYVYSTLGMPRHSMSPLYLCLFCIYLPSIYLFFHINIRSIYMPFLCICLFFMYFPLYLCFFIQISPLYEFLNIFWLSKNRTSYKILLYAVAIKKRTF